MTKVRCSSGRTADVQVSHSVDAGAPKLTVIVPQSADRRFRCGGPFSKAGPNAGPFRVFCRAEVQQLYASTGEPFWTHELGPDRDFVKTDPGAAFVYETEGGAAKFKIWLSPEVR